MERCRHMQRNLPSAGRTVDLVEVLLAVGLAHKIDSVACTVAAEAVHHKGCNFVEEVRRKLVWVGGPTLGAAPYGALCCWGGLY